MTDHSEQKPEDYYDLYSRQYFTFGEHAMNKIGKAQIFINHVGGVGVEIAKNLILAGVQRVTLCDDKVAQLSDLSTQYYLTENDIGANRATVSLAKLSELNPYVTVDVYEGEFNKEALLGYTTVILTETPLSQQLEINDFCRENGIKFIVADTYGLFAWTFNDFGDSFTVVDPNGEPESDVFIQNITNEKQAVVECLEGRRHNFSEGDFVKIVELKEGMEPLNFIQGEREIYFKVVDSMKGTSFVIDVDTTEFPPYVSGGIAVEKKQPIEKSYKSLRESLESPELLIFDWAQMMRPYELHVAMQALHKFMEREGRLPNAWDTSDAEAVVELANSINSENTNEDITKILSFTAQGSILPLAAVLGGHVAQEAIKSVTGKYTPLDQFLYMDAAELVNAEDDHTPYGDRYDSQVICLGRSTHRKLLDTKLFMIGCGAIGCEMMKNYAMLGVSSGNGQITVADNDVIEKSNLNRQFLFRDKDIREPKSKTAANAVLDINPSLNIDAHLDKICPESEATFDDQFLQSCDIVVNALDNVQARLYVDSRCVTNHRPLLESGTMGTKGHIQVILPNLTETYGSKVDPPETDVPYCTIKSFPSQMEHCIEWARDKFESLFVSKPREVQKFLNDQDGYISSLRGVGAPPLNVLKYIVKILQNPPRTFEDCIALGRKRLASYYNNAIRQLLHAFPADLKMKDGSLFWKLPKRPPVPLSFDTDSTLMIEFLRSYAVIYARMFKIDFDLDQWDLSSVAEFATTVEVPEFTLKKKSFVTDETVAKDDAEKEEEANQDEFEDYCQKLENLVGISGVDLEIDEFEKDDDSNFHIAFIHSCAALRATNYNISHGDRMETKRIAGKIIPAIATTTAVVSGLVSLEFVKIIMGGHPLENFKNCFLNLALPVYSRSEPGEPTKIPITGEAYYTIWDKWEIENNPEITVQEFAKTWEEKLGLTVTGIFHDVKMVYVSVLPNHKSRLGKPVKQFLRGVTEPYVDLVVTFADENGQDVNGPPVRLHLE